MDDPFFSVSADDTGSTCIGRSRSLFDNTAQVMEMCIRDSSEAVYDGESKVEDVTCIKVESWEEAK